MHSVYVEQVGLPSPLQAEAQFLCLVISAACFNAARDCTRHPHLCNCRARADEPSKGRRNQASLDVLYTSQADL